ncbi:hypothetical protein P775_04390 [Puniceibacterium antarcticum]|uniref:4Fe-4S ferredoxin-type domain-containing protein n=2 Tax=Puniceibacterium antarcticum TaxID=1206336 RepID=A0A2G8RIT0_9RHOB|nr:hypothetical protein P775_04390 [Puniceibacterium antarcticum]
MGHKAAELYGNRTMTNPTQSLYAARLPIFPRRVSGYFRRLKWALMLVTLGIYYLTPWLRWERGPDMPDQAVLIDLANRRFYFFMIEIWPHEFYFVAGMLVMAGLALFLFTAALGRVWCGYACPQTVWTDLFILVERWIEGDRNARVRLHEAPWSLHKWRLRISKWVVWLIIGLLTGGAWVFYFTDAPTLLRDLASFSAPPVAYMTIAILTATTFVFGGFMREQVCIYMCPWPRIQAAMMDEDTLTVAYRDWRGEPRGKGLRRRAAAEAAEASIRAAGPQIGPRSPVIPMPGRPAMPSAPVLTEHKGDCIDCNACVNVCPMGIDIRDGQQMACITCALCIDACDEVMEKTGQPRGLIDYIALSDAPKEAAGDQPKSVWRHVLRARNLIYAGLWSGIGIALIFALFLRPDVEMTVAPIRNPTHVVLADGTIRNAYDVRVRNKQGTEQIFHVSLDHADLIITVEGSTSDKIAIPADSQGQARVYVDAPAGSHLATHARSDLRLWVTDQETGERAAVDTNFTGKDDE